MKLTDKKNYNEKIQLTSIAKNINEVGIKDNESVNRLTIEANKQQRIKQLPRRFKDNPAFKFFAYIEKTIKKIDHVENPTERSIAKEKNSL